MKASRYFISFARIHGKKGQDSCGSSRFLGKGFDIRKISFRGTSRKLTRKALGTETVLVDIVEYDPPGQFDYIFISSGSVSLFTDMQQCKKILYKMKTLLKQDGKFVFAVDTVANRAPDDTEYQTFVSVKTGEGYDLLLKGKNCYDEATHTQFSPSIYELDDGTALLRSEPMDFQTHLYELGELEPYLFEIGFRSVAVYSSFEKEIAEDNRVEMFLYECRL